jgi:DNA polymerase alpha subunit A
MSELHAEVMSIMSKFKVTEFKAKKSTRKYAFELPNIPAESDYLKVLYGYKAPSLPADLQGECFSHVFGTNTALFEQFVLFRRILGPCWLRLNNPDLRAAVNTTWTRFEFGVDDPEHITPIQEPAKEGLPDTPPMTVMSVALRTVLNKQDNKTEIVVASARTYNNVNLDDPIPADKLPCTSYTVVRPPSKVFPNGFEAEAKRQNIAIERSETALLNSFMARWHMSDPDIIVGHDWESVGFGVLLARLKEKRITTWHRVGRYKRSEWPRTVGRAGFFAERQLAVGRLMCDLSNDLGRSIIRAQSWTLTEICKLELGITRPEVDNEKAATALTETARGLLDFTMRCSMDTHYQTAIAIQVQILPLSKQLTCLAGNSWAATLSGTRAQRNEFILLHEFHKNKYICPDKVWGKQKAVVEDENEDGDAPTGKKKDKFKGGLVFEPEKGLYDKFILVMDFNSLYPSIIQEYNICFTTVVRSDDLDASGEEVVPDPPPSDVGQGILPRLIATLVERRREVKKLFKMKDATDAQKAGWDIRQLALKLTANSMYGCLGYTRSRFYARPLAMLTTFKGREVLTNTKELADDQQLQVIYGDTDSVMINTNVDNYLDAMKIGNEFKKNVNERYRLLEIDIDNVFQRMLLHAKKKYAALVLSDERGKLVAKTEVKGLDMRRREYCMLSKEASQYCLDRILSGEQTELVVEQIHNYLRDFSAKMRAGEFSKGKFIILNKLGKEPEAYPNGKTMPHVQVALKRRAKGDPVRVNDVMQYIITGEPGDARHVAERAYPAGDVTRPKSELNIDYDWYLAHQILPPLERLCAPIEGTDRVRIAECLGLDPNKYKLHEAHEQQSRELTLFESTISDEERFADAEALRFRCRNCAQEATYAGLVQSSLMAGPQGLQCHRCQTLLQPASIEAQLQAQICKFIAQYYENWLVCDDSACGTRTQQCGVYGRRCLNAGCRGMMSYAYNDKMLYNQLLYFDHVFDVDKAMTAATVAALGTDEKVQQVRVHAEQLRVPFDRYRGLVNSYLRKCGRRYVDMASLFAFCQ